MRAVALILTVLFVLGWIASIVPSSKSTPALESTWRRTVNGWEKGTWLSPGPSEQVPALHPVALGVLQTLFSVLAFVLFPRIEGKPLPDDGTPESLGQARAVAEAMDKPPPS